MPVHHVGLVFALVLVFRVQQGGGAQPNITLTNNHNTHTNHITETDDSPHTHTHTRARD